MSGVLHMPHTNQRDSAKLVHVLGSNSSRMLWPQMNWMTYFYDFQVASHSACESYMDRSVVPSDIGRIPHKILSGFASLTADQFKNWIMHFSVITLRDIWAVSKCSRSRRSLPGTGTTVGVWGSSKWYCQWAGWDNVSTASSWSSKWSAFETLLDLQQS